MENILLFGVELVVVVKRIVDFLKGQFPALEGNAVRRLVIIVTLTLLALNEVAEVYPAVAVWWERIFTIVFVALGAAEIYELGRDVRLSRWVTD